MRHLGPGVLSRRDIAVLRDLDRVRLLSGRQLERLHFADLATSSARGSARRRSLGRLHDLGLVVSLPRRVGGVRAGSAGLVYCLDARAQRERSLWQIKPSARPTQRQRRPWAVGWLFVSHNLDVAELYVQLRESERRGDLSLLRFDAEPAAWFTTANGTLKPDAFVVIEIQGWERHWWIEVDRATESLPTLRRKFGHYLDVLRSGKPGPDGVLPRVLVTVPEDRRRDQLRELVNQLTDDDFIEVVRLDRALDVLPGEEARPPP